MDEQMKNNDLSQDQEESKTDDSLHTESEPKQSQPTKNNTCFFKKHKQGTLLAGCFLLALAGGFAGTSIADQISKKDSVVLYESAPSKQSNGEKKEGILSVKEVSEQVSKSVVEIQTESISTNPFFPQAVQSGAGSGVILSKDGYIVTNHHVINGADKIVVITTDGKSHPAKLIGHDAATDLAIVKIEETNLVPATLGKSNALEVGDTAIAIGNPLGKLGGTVTNGIISALDREITIDNQQMHLLQTNAAINPGNSGGGLFNDHGELIGIVNAKSSGENIEGLGFAIPIDRAKPIIDNLISNGYVKGRPSLGVMLSVANNPYDQNNSVLFVVDVVDGSAAQKAGIQKGDQILNIDGKPVSDVSDLKTLLNEHKAKDSVKIKVLRDNETKEFKVILDEAKEQKQ